MHQGVSNFYLVGMPQKKHSCSLHTAQAPEKLFLVHTQLSGSSKQVFLAFIFSLVWSLILPKGSCFVNLYAVICLALGNVLHFQLGYCSLTMTDVFYFILVLPDWVVLPPWGCLQVKSLEQIMRMHCFFSHNICVKYETQNGPEGSSSVYFILEIWGPKVLGGNKGHVCSVGTWIRVFSWSSVGRSPSLFVNNVKAVLGYMCLHSGQPLDNQHNVAEEMTAGYLFLICHYHYCCVVSPMQMTLP